MKSGFGGMVRFRPLRVKNKVFFKKNKKTIWKPFKTFTGMFCHAGAWLKIVGIILSTPPIHSTNSIRNDNLLLTRFLLIGCR